MVDLFIPYKQLKEALKIRTDVTTVTAYLKNQDIAWSVKLSAIADVDTWMDAIDRMLRRQSSTVVLCTACNCMQEVDLDDRRQLVEYLVPVYNKVNSQYSNAIINTNQPVFRVRRFKWNYVHFNEGFKLLEECLE